MCNNMELTISQAAARLGVSRSTIEYYIRNGKLRAGTALGGSIITVGEQDVDALVRRPPGRPKIKLS